MERKHGPEILKVLGLVQGPKRVTAIEVGNRKPQKEITWQLQLQLHVPAAAAAKRAAASGELLQLPLIPTLPLCELTPSVNLPRIK